MVLDDPSPVSSHGKRCTRDQSQRGTMMREAEVRMMQPKAKAEVPLDSGEARDRFFPGASRRVRPCLPLT